ncbi:class I SAM-dependent methyltransferase [Devosia sp.]|uniref:class I SAM-dependent methyltransferase n=1 Tax=Devosia sp. TaxID=1871048 RepID=UPI0035B3A70C
MSDFWDERYATEAYVFGEVPNAFLVSQQGIVGRCRTALAVADGEGRNGVWLAEQGLAVTTLDASAVGIGKARALAARRGVALDARLVDLAGYAWPEAAYDLVVAIFIQFADPVLRDEIFAGMQRALVPGGRILLEGYRPEQLAFGTGGPRQLDKLYTREMLEAAFADLEIEQLRAYDAEIVEGTGHVGMSALIDLVARKPA